MDIPDVHKKRVVGWTYRDHVLRWLVVAVAGLNALWMAAEALAESQRTVDGGTGIIIATLLVAFWLFVAYVCARPTIDGFIVRRGPEFEIDLGRQAFDLFGAFSEVYHILGRMGAASLGQLNSAIQRRMLPRRTRYVGALNPTAGVSIEAGPIGPSLVIRLDATRTVRFDDIPARDVARIHSEIESLLRV